MAPQLIYPANAPQETSRWRPGNYYIEERDLVLPAPSPRTSVGIYLVVYFWQDGRRVPAPGTDDQTALYLRQLRVMAY